MAGLGAPRRASWRWLSLGASTLLGRARGFFIPYRYADGVVAPTAYPQIEALFAAAEPRFREVLAALESVDADLARIAEDAPAPAPRWGQSWFPGLDAAALYAIIRTRRPRVVLEVGSGHSTRFAARAIADAGLETRHICIDPAPRAALEGLPVEWRRELLGPAHAPLFDALGPGDVAFFDSSHILMPGTDVDLILNRLAPALRDGVLVHFHDVFLPDPYPASWAWRGYNEQNALGGALAGGGFAPLFSSRYARTRMAVAAFPAWRDAPESSLWMIRRSL